MNAAARANLPHGRHFEDLSTSEKNEFLRAVLALPAIVSVADSAQSDWLKLLFAIADAGHCGATDAYELAIGWSKHGKSFQSEVDFSRDWFSFRHKPGGITVATLIQAAELAGLDTSTWLQARPAMNGLGVPAGNSTAAFHPLPFFSPVRFTSADLRRVDWLADGLLVVGDLTVIAGPGGSAKTAFRRDDRYNACRRSAALRPDYTTTAARRRARGLRVGGRGPEQTRHVGCGRVRHAKPQLGRRRLRQLSARHVDDHRYPSG